MKLVSISEQLKSLPYKRLILSYYRYTVHDILTFEIDATKCNKFRFSTVLNQSKSVKNLD